MRNENKVLRYNKFFGIILVCVLLFTACSNMFNDPISGDQGKIIIDFAQGKERSIFPLMVFDRYEYLFTKAGETAVVEKFPDSNGMFTLDVGNHTVEVLAYTNNNTLTARGISAQFTVGTGQNAAVYVPLSSAIPVGQGQFSYTITYPIGTVAQVTLQRWSDMSNITLTPASQGNGIYQTLNNLVSGSYLLTVRVNRDGLVTGISEAIHIYPSLTTEYRKNFTENDFLVIPISTDAELNAIRNNLSGSYILVNDIILSGNWTPIGTSTNPFTGVFDGNGYTISGLTINSTSGRVGMFGQVGLGGIVKNLGLINVNITGGGTVGHTGGIVGNNSGTVQNCYTTGSVSGSGTSVSGIGGIVGVNLGIVQNCYSMSTVTGIDSVPVGGIVGSNNETGIVRNCYSTSDFIGNSRYAGGIVGYNFRGTVENCYSTGDINSSFTAGGIVGYDLGTTIVKNCVALNPRVFSLDGSSGRIQPYTSGTLTNNYGRNGMIVKTTPITTGNHNDRHGANVTTEQAVTQDWWNAPTAGWDTTSPWDFTNVWYPADGARLPTLRNMPGGNTQNPVIQF
jgi:hypothetical protein